MQSLASTREWSAEGTSLNVRTLPELYRKWEFRQRASLCSVTWVPFRAPEMNRRKKKKKKKKLHCLGQSLPNTKIHCNFLFPSICTCKALIGYRTQQEDCTVDGVCLKKKKKESKKIRHVSTFCLGPRSSSSKENTNRHPKKKKKERTSFKSLQRAEWRG